MTTPQQLDHMIELSINQVVQLHKQFINRKSHMFKLFTCQGPERFWGAQEEMHNCFYSF